MDDLGDDTRLPGPAGNPYLAQLTERINSISSASWGDEASKQGVLSGLLAARELHLHLAGQPSAWGRRP